MNDGVWHPATSRTSFLRKSVYYRRHSLPHNSIPALDSVDTDTMCFVYPGERVRVYFTLNNLR